MTSIEQAESWIGRTAVDSTGEQMGLITQIWVDDTSNEPEWASVKVVGLRGREALVPLAGAAAFGGGRRFAYTREEILDAPHAGHDGRLEAEDKDGLAEYYGTAGSDPELGSATWVDRLEGAADGANVREIRALEGDGPAPAPKASAPQETAPPETQETAPKETVAQKARGRFGRKFARSTS